MNRPRKSVPMEELVGKACHAWDYAHRRCLEEVDVFHLPQKTAVHFLAKLAIDADGSPWAYHPNDVRPPDNAAKAYDWLANIDRKYLHGVQGKDATGPAPGFYVSATSLVDPSVANQKDTRRYVDAGHVPYIVLPTNLPLPEGMALPLGSLAWIADLETGRGTGAIFADTGRAVGEGSVALARWLGLSPFHAANPPKVIGFDERRFLQIIFPGEVIPPPWPVQKIQEKARKLFEKWGGWSMVRALHPGVPAGGSVRKPAPAPEAEPAAPKRAVRLGPLVRQVIGGALRLRKAPLIEAENILAVLPHGHLVEVLDRPEESPWWKVRTRLPAGPAEGFVHSNFLGPPARKKN